MKNKKRIIHSWMIGMIIGIIVNSSVVFAETRDFLFHMNTTYAHGKQVNCGYSAYKADDEQNAYITVNRFDKEGSPTISIWVAPYGGTAELTNPWSWTSTRSVKVLGYNTWRGKSSHHQLCAEQFGTKSVVIGGRWTP